MEAAILKCPMCGAAASSEATQCEHCGARLATVSCPSCFGLMFAGEKFCPHCGAKAQRAEAAPEEKPQGCPRCGTAMEAVAVGGVNLRECPKCEGLWCDAETLRQICADREKQGAVMGMAAGAKEEGPAPLEAKVRYLPCPVCRQLMNRVNFAGCSGVIVDVCREHGTWFDRDELRRVVKFVQAGGMEKSRQQEIEHLKERTRAARFEASLDHSWQGAGYEHRTWRHGVIFDIAGSLLDLLR